MRWRIGILKIGIFMTLLWLSLEIGTYTLVRADILQITEPSYSFGNVSSTFWRPHAVFGVWHEPGSQYRHVKPCFDLEYKANSHGMRDIERSLETSSRKRFIVLGDSLVEGYGSRLQDRWTNLLEEGTGIEHLNFGSSGHFGTTQSYLLYTRFAKSFDHDGVIVALTPANDFWDDDLEMGRQVHFGRYRPYLVGTFPNYELTYYKRDMDRDGYLEKALKFVRDLAREYTYTFHSLDAAWSWGVRFFRQREKRQRRYSGYYDFTEAQFDRMAYAIIEIAKAAEGRVLAIVTFPFKNDLERFEKDATSELAPRLARLANEIGASYLDLLPLMYAQTDDWRSYFLGCDGHYNRYGNQVAHELLREALPLYNP